ncbi:transcriptional regulator [Pyrodictium abyssi]|uniref:HTH arsR-type domain-containing protein n=1 Tax=Pyrodictium abyssi TaxID=54256 RepID=A0ABM8IZX4_9CREN|nr:hypothetical protein PABY_19890 [Pyrodictium abyssi]
MPGEEEIRRALELLRRSPLQSPVRLAVMLLLAARHSMEFSDLQRALGVTPGNLWSHLEKLRKAGLVRVRYRPWPGQGPRMIVEATGEGLEALFRHLHALRVLEEAAGSGREEAGGSGAGAEEEAARLRRGSGAV